MRALPRILIATLSSIAALAVVAPAVAHDSRAAHEMPGKGGTMGPGMMGEMGSEMMDLMGAWMSDRGQGEHPGMGTDAPTHRQVPAMPGMQGQGMAPGMDGPRMPQMPEMPGRGDEMPGMRAPGFQMQIAPGWWG